MLRPSGGGERRGLQCYVCGQAHHIRDCPQNKNASGGGGGGGGDRRASGGGYRGGAPSSSGAGGAPGEVQLNLGHTVADAQKRIKQLLIMMTADEQSLTRMSLALLEDIKMYTLGEFVSTTVLHCVKCLPQKAMLFVGLLAAMRAHQLRQPGGLEEADAFLNVFLTRVTEELQAACQASRWDELRLLLRFACGLGAGGLVAMPHVWALTNKLQAYLADESLATSKREYLLFTLFSLVPFLAEAHDTDEFIALRQTLELQLAARTQRTEMLSLVIAKPSSSSSSSAATANYLSAPFCFDLLECWSAALGALRTKAEYLADASEVSVQRTSYQCFREAIEKAPPVAWHAAQHLTLPTQSAPRLRPVLRLFPRGYEGFPLNDLLVGDYISDLLVAFEALHKEGTKQLLSLPLPLSDEARQVGQYLLIESLFENLLALPKSPVRAVYYGTILIDLFKAQPNLMPPLVGAAVNFLFHRLEQLDVEVVERLLDWFTFHLSNFGYVWPWVSWNYVLEQSESNPQRQFVQQALALCVRLSYWERIQQVIPEEFIALMPHQPLPAFRFSTKNIQNTNGDLNIQQYFQFSLELISIIQGKSLAPAVIQWLDQNVTPTLGSEARVRLLTPCILECGNKSYSHLIALLDRYKNVFQTLCTTTTKRKPPPATKEGEDAPMTDVAAPVEAPMPTFDVQRLILHSISEYWQHSLQHLIVVVDQFFVHGVLSIQSILAWTFFAVRNPQTLPHLWRPILYPLLTKALEKVREEAATIRAKPRAMLLTQEKRDADEAALAALDLEARDLLVMPVSNFQKLLVEAQTHARRATKDKDRERYEAIQKALVARFKQFTREFAHELAPHVEHLRTVVPDASSPIHPLLAQIPMLL